MKKEEKNPLQQVIDVQMDAQRNKISNDKEPDSFFTRLGKLLGIFMAASIILGLLFNLLRFF
ncbi:hypothetical protein [Hutsoniella sourekii]|uniref:hypothetical protein n=1 Tax=Hutsoniella sourekii TaxID=87650 RepID=UPI000481D486|nr:hypothetical protein [Hutsoniella sourekii]